MLWDSNGQNYKVTFLIRAESRAGQPVRVREKKDNLLVRQSERLLNLCLSPWSQNPLARCVLVSRQTHSSSLHVLAWTRMRMPKTQKNSRRTSNLRMLHAAGHALSLAPLHFCFLGSFSHFCSRLSVCAEAQVIIHWWLLSTDKRPPIMTALFTCFHYGSNAKVSLCARLFFLFHLVVMISPTLHIL